METWRTRRLLLVAFALSLIVHAVIALRMQWPFASPRDETQSVSLERRPRVLVVSKLPTPPPASPKPVTTPSPTAVPARASARPTLPRPNAMRSAGPSVPRQGASTVAVATAAPTVEPIATGCTKPDAIAGIVATPPPPDIAPAVRATATSAIIRVQVKLDEHGTVTDATVAQGSGNASLDIVAVSMARSAQYSPAYRACKAIASTYTFSARFIPW